MDIEFVCEHCGKTLKVQEYLAGQSIECYHCHAQVRVPAEGEKAVIEFACLGCGTPFRVPASRAGSRTKCPKCDALLVVPDSRAAAAPAPSATLGAAAPPPPPAASSEFDNLPPPSSPYARKHAMLRRRTARPGAPGAAGEDEEFIAPPANKVSAGMIIFWVGLVAVFLITIVMFLMRSDEGPGGPAWTGATIEAEVKYNEFNHIFLIKNGMRQGWSGTTVTLETLRGNFVYNAGEVPPSSEIKPTDQQFIGPGGSFDLAAGAPKRVIIKAQLSNGLAGLRIINWGGLKKPQAPTNPNATPPEPKSGETAPPAEPDKSGEEGGTITE